MTWLAVGHELLDDAQVRSAAQALAATRAVAASAARPIILLALIRLDLFALERGDAGVVGQLSDAELAATAWPETLDDTSKRLGSSAKVGGLLRGVLRGSGLLEGEGAEERLARHEHRARMLLQKRARSKRAREVPDAARPGAPSSSPSRRFGGIARPGLPVSGPDSSVPAHAKRPRGEEKTAEQRHTQSTHLGEGEGPGGGEPPWMEANHSKTCMNPLHCEDGLLNSRAARPHAPAPAQPPPPPATPLDDIDV